MPISAHKFHFLQITFFSAVITRTHTPTHTHSVFPTHYALKKTLNTCFLKIHFFSLYSFSLPPKHFLIFFSGKVATKKWSKNLPKEGKKFSFFYNFFHIFPLPLRKKKPLTFSALFITGNRKTARENVP